MAVPPRVILCKCINAEKVIPPAVKQAVLGGLQESGVEFEVISDLCELSARKDPTLKRLADSTDLRIAACYPRAVKWLFCAAGAPLQDDRVKLSNMRDKSADQVVSDLLHGIDGKAQAHQHSETESESGKEESGSFNAQALGEEIPHDWIPWFPVIDYDLCGNCKQCLSFCLFGVFATDDEDRIHVQNPQNCKTNCPACSRVCPSVAIIFPKYDKAPINGDVVREEDARRDVVKVDISRLFAEGVHPVLAERGRNARQRFSIETDESRGVEERRRCLEKAKEDLDIPDDVLAGLPLAGGTGRVCACSCEGQERAEETVQPESDRDEPATAEEWGI